MDISPIISSSIVQASLFGTSSVRSVTFLLDQSAAASVSSIEAVDISGLGQLLSASSIFKTGILSAAKTGEASFSTVATATQFFVDAFNSFLQSGSLQGSLGGSLGNLFTQLLSTQSSASSSEGESILASLSAIGITLQAPTAQNTTGQLVVDFETLQAAFNADQLGTVSVFAQATQSIGQLATEFTSLFAQVSGLTQGLEDFNSTATLDGLLAATLTAETAAAKVAAVAAEAAAATATGTTAATAATGAAATGAAAVTGAVIVTGVPAATEAAVATGVTAASEAAAVAETAAAARAIAAAGAAVAAEAAATARTLAASEVAEGAEADAVARALSASLTAVTENVTAETAAAAATRPAAATVSATRSAATTELVAAPVATGAPATATLPSAAVAAAPAIAAPAAIPQVAINPVGQIIDTSNPAVAAAIAAYHVIDGIFDSSKPRVETNPNALPGYSEIQSVTSIQPIKLDLYA